MSSGGYGNDRSDGPPRDVLSQETIREALQRANSESGKISSPKRTNTSSRSPPADSTRRGPSTAGPKHENCRCIDCRDTSYRDTAGTMSRDKNGDRVLQLADGEELPLHAHVQPGLWDGINNEPPAPRRTGTNSSTRSNSGKNENISYKMNQNGDMEQEWKAEKPPPVRSHYNWDENQVQFPGEGAPLRKK